MHIMLPDLHHSACPVLVYGHTYIRAYERFPSHGAELHQAHGAPAAALCVRFDATRRYVLAVAYPEQREEGDRLERHLVT